MKAKVPYKKSKKRVGCGLGSGHGKTSCKGHKGQKARSGYSSRAGFEGGQNPLYRRLPKRGFNAARFRKEYRTVNLSLIETLDEKAISPEVLLARGVLNNLKSDLKVLGNGDLTKAVEVSAHSFSESAKEKIAKAGGKVIIIDKKSQDKAEK